MTENSSIPDLESSDAKEESPGPWQPSIRTFAIDEVCAPLPPFPTIDDTLANVLAQLHHVRLVVVLGLPRAATKAILHFFHANFPGKAVHAHGVSARYLEFLTSLPPHSAAKKTERFERVRHLIEISSHTTVVVPFRSPFTRLPSYFIYLNRHRIGQYFQASSRTFLDKESIQADFDRFVEDETRREQVWYREELIEPFGLDLLRIPPPTMKQATVSRCGGRTFVFVRAETITDTLTRAISSIKGWSGSTITKRNSAEDFQLGDARKSFDLNIRISHRAVQALREIPFVAHFFGEDPLCS